ncbi:MAG: hypothetical protein AAB948_00050 [Patescibacteria group bacterium]
MRQNDLRSLLCAAAVAGSVTEARELRKKFVNAIGALDGWVQCVMLDLYDEMLRQCPERLPDQFVFYMSCCHSEAGTTEHGLGALEQALLAQCT